MRSLLERQRVANESVGTFDAVAVAVDGTEANAQVFQVRDGVLSDRQSFYLDNEARAGRREVAEEFLLQYYTSALAIPPLIVVQQEVADGRDAVLAELLGERRGGPVEMRAAERGDKRRILELAERNARLALDQEKLKAERRRQQRVEALTGLQAALGLDALPVRIECFDISQPRRDAHGRVDGRVRGRRAEEGRLPAFHDPQRRGRAPTTSHRWTRCCPPLRAVRAPARRSPHDADRDASLRGAAEPRRDRRRQGPAVGRPRARCAGLRERGVAVVVARQADRGGVRARAGRRRCGSTHDTPELQLLQRVRDEAHRFAITHHRIRRDKAMTESMLDDLPGVGPTRKRALLQHFGSPEAVLGRRRASSSRRCPACRRRSRRDLYPTSNKSRGA